MLKLLPVCLLSLSLTLNAQQTPHFSQYLPEAPALSDYERVLLRYANDPGLQAAPGWKYLARYAHAQSIRAEPDGSPADLATLFTETRRIEAWKQTAGPGFRSAMWSPAGPFSAPTPNSDFLIEGTGRINTITFHPTDPDIMWIGGGQGGLWKTTNGAASWFPLGDDLPVMRVSDIAVNPHDPDEMYLCIGDYAYLGFWIRTNDRKRNTHFGMGVYKSTDGGLTWNPTGLTFSQLDLDHSLTRRVFINPENTSQLLAAGIHGIWMSEDAGDTWDMISEEIIWDIEKDPADFRTLYASTAFINNLQIGTAGILKSTDFGETWTTLNTGIPAQNQAQRIEISVSPVNPQTVYAVACNLNGGLYGFYRSTDGGQSWELRASFPNILHWSSGENSISGQGSYDLAILADPVMEDRVYVSGVNNWMSEDGGITWQGTSYWTGTYGPSVHADHHFLAYNPLDAQYYLCHDGGVSRTDTIKAGSWQEALNNPDFRWPTKWEHLNNGLANLSFYRLGISQSSGNIFAGAQDMGTF
ncbi:MAG: hypothetical protein R3301_15070, partial [Saprospiraceae bacterium]|nr:hypothetical protein [Saprospiraceae bacterium]